MNGLLPSLYYLIDGKLSSKIGPVAGYFSRTPKTDFVAFQKAA